MSDRNAIAKRNLLTRPVLAHARFDLIVRKKASEDWLIGRHGRGDVWQADGGRSPFRFREDDRFVALTTIERNGIRGTWLRVHPLLWVAARTKGQVKSVSTAAVNASAILPKTAEDEAKPSGHTLTVYHE
jgi:hypothetical protein